MDKTKGLRALVIGATGATGLELVGQLLETDAVESVTVFVRNGFPYSHPKLLVQQVDFEQPELWAPLVVGEVAFSAMGTTLKAAGTKERQWKVDYDYQYNFAQSARANGIPNFVLVSAIGADAQSGVFYSKMKGALEQAIRALDFKKLTIFQPSLLIRPETDRKTEKTFEGLIQFLNRLGIAKKYRPITVADLARKMIEHSLNADVGTRIITTKELFK
ncbi:NAD(P)H-binding protein [Flavobacterium sp. JP2137]|uniref:NAD(P)H-binding protein n=1 Tax=Flavobacterium sp. JP2137 TaxID=3414510 RepID=UPI003D2FEC42